MTDQGGQELTDLFADALTINKELQNFGTPNVDKLREGIEKARNLAAKVQAESVSITAGFPAGISITVTFKGSSNT